jgi:flagellar biosynthetic protein FliR
VSVHLHLNIETQWLVTFILIFSRISAVLASPLFSGHLNIPLRIRLLVILGVSLILTGSVNFQLPVVGLLELTLFVLTEYLNGLFLFLGVASAVYSIELAGRLIDYQGGLSAANVFNPASKEQSSLFGILLLLLFVFFFYALDLHHEVLLALKYSFYAVPIGGNILDLGVSVVAVMLMKMASFGVLLAAPVCIVLFLIDVVAGVIAKSMPQVNVYFLLLPVKVFVCILTLLMSIESSLLVFDMLSVAIIDFMDV